MGMLKPTDDKGMAGKWGKVIRLISKALGLKQPIKDWTPALLPVNAGLSTIVIGTKKDQENWEIKPENDLIKQGGEPAEQL